MAYTSDFSGAQIDAAVEMASKMHFGTETVNIEDSTTAKTIRIGVLPYNVAQIIATVRTDSSPNNTEATVMLYRSAGVWYAYLMSRTNYTMMSGNLVRIDHLIGTYYIDWMAIEK